MVDLPHPERLRARTEPDLYDPLLAALPNYAPDRYDAATVAGGVAQLREDGWLERVATPAYSAERHGSAREAREGFARQLELLRVVGRGHLPLGRVFEGHVNALELIERFGDGEQRERYLEAARSGALFGVWNTEFADGVHQRPNGADGYRLEGAKTFCSGADVLDYAIVPGQRWSSGGRALGWQMCVVDMRVVDPAAREDDFWQPLGMQASASHRVDFTGVELGAEALLGEPDDYHRQPHFSGGAVRFAAVQLGGAEALYDQAVGLLRELRRERDPYQAQRIGRMAIALEGGRNWLRGATDAALCAWRDESGVVDYANMTRTAILQVCESVLAETEMAVGARGMLSPKSIQRIYCDLKMYLRQPAPDSALAAVGHHAASSHAMPGAGEPEFES